MQELDKLNPHKGVATNSMVLFLAINTSGVAVLPLGVVAIRASLGAETEGRGGVAETEDIGRHVHDHGAHRRVLHRNVGEEATAGIIVPTILATLCSTVVEQSVVRRA